MEASREESQIQHDKKESSCSDNELKELSIFSAAHLLILGVRVTGEGKKD